MRFWSKLIDQVALGHINHAIFIAYSLEQLQQSLLLQLPMYHMTEYPMCICKRRIQFDQPGRKKPSSPTHANAIIYVPGKENRIAQFRDEFSRYGGMLNT
jgi:hypothetical protein